MIWFHIFEEFITSYFKNHLKLVHIILLVEFSNILSYLQTHIFEKPRPFNSGWLGDHTLYAQIENLFKHVHE